MKRIFVLGAGSSRFSGFPTGEGLLQFLKRECDQLRNMVNGKEEREEFLIFMEKVNRILPDHRKLHGEPDLEFVLSLGDLNNRQRFIEDHYSLVGELESIMDKLKLSNSELATAQRAFKMLVASAFTHRSHQIQDEILLNHNCNSTVTAWTQLVHEGDILISFNWDLLQELVLKRAGLWSHEDGYGVQCNPAKETFVPSKVILLKLHGSCTWSLRHPSDQTLHLDYIDNFFLDPSLSSFGIEKPLGSSSDDGYSLIVPSYLKDPFKINVLSSIWRKAYNELVKATCLVVLGYSLPNADYFARKLFQEAIEDNENLESIKVIVGEDAEAFRRWEGIGRGKCVRVVGGFEDYVIGETS